MRRHLCTIGLLAGVLLAAACGGDTPEARTATGGDGGPRYEGDFTVLESPDHGPQLCAFVATSLPPQCGGPDIEGWDWDAVDGEESASGVTWGDYHVTGTFADGRFTPTAPAGPRDPGDVADQPAPDFSPACDEPEVTDPAQGIPPSGAMEDAPDLVASWVSNPGTDWDGDSLVVNFVVLPGRGAAARDLIRQTYGGALCVVEREGPTLAELAGIQAELMDADATEHLGQVQSAGPDGIIGKVRATVWVADGPALDYAQQRWGDLVQLEGLLQPTS